MNLSFQAECSRVIDDLARMTENMEPKLEVRLESVEQEPGTDGTAETQLEEAKQELEAAETQLEGAKQELEAAEAQLEKTRQELAATKGAKLSAETQLDVAIRALYCSMDLLCSERGIKASAEEKEVTSTANVHTDHAYQSQERASDPLPTSQSNGPRSTRTEATPKRKKDPTKTWRFATAVASEDTVQASNAENDLKNEMKDAPEKGRHSTPAPDPAQSEGTCSHASGITKRIRSM